MDYHADTPEGSPATSTAPTELPPAHPAEEPEDISYDMKDMSDTLYHYYDELQAPEIVDTGSFHIPITQQSARLWTVSTSFWEPICTPSYGS